MIKNNQKKKLITIASQTQLINSSGNTETNPCVGLLNNQLDQCVKKYILTNPDPRTSGSMLGYYLVVSPKKVSEKIIIIRNLYQNQNVKNKCYDMFLRAGNYTYTLLGDKALAYNLIICRSMFKVGLYQAMKGKFAKKKLIQMVSTICDLDPEKNGCADGIGRLIYDYGYSFKDASKACTHGDTLSAPNESFYEGCMGGYGNWSRYGSFFKEYKSIQEVRTKLCANIDTRGFTTCMGYGMRSYVRNGLETGNFQSRLDEYYEKCMVNPVEDIKSFCSAYLGFTLADVYNDRNGLGQPLKGKPLSAKVDHYCQADEPCLANFISWYINQWAFSNDGKLNIEGSNQVCKNLLVASKNYCYQALSFETDRYNKRLVKAAKE